MVVRGDNQGLVRGTSMHLSINVQTYTSDEETQCPGTTILCTKKTRTKSSIFHSLKLMSLSGQLCSAWMATQVMKATLS